MAIPGTIIYRMLTVATIALLVLPAARAHADGGMLRAMIQAGDLQVAVFTEPVVLTAGQVDFSVLVQDAATMQPIPSAQVEVHLASTHGEHNRLRASRETATNKLFQACHAVLDAGQYDVQVVVSDSSRQANIPFTLQVGPAPTPAAAFWPWYCWPAVPIGWMTWHAWRRAHASSDRLQSTYRVAATTRE